MGFIDNDPNQQQNDLFLASRIDNVIAFLVFSKVFQVFYFYFCVGEIISLLKRIEVMMLMVASGALAGGGVCAGTPRP